MIAFDIPGCDVCRARRFGQAELVARRLAQEAKLLQVHAKTFLLISPEAVYMSCIEKILPWRRQ